LLYGQIGSGRTHLLAHVFIRRSIEIGDFVQFFDHAFLTTDARMRGIQVMQANIERVCDKFYPEYECIFKRSNNSVRVSKRRTNEK
jgi:hypothetical protein